jgi:hypothetical protein
MSRLVLIIAVVFVVAVGGFTVFLATWNPPAPSAKIEKVVPDDRFPR